VRAHRTAGRRKQTVVAGLTGITADYLYEIERGMKLPTITVLGAWGTPIDKKLSMPRRLRW
jgi:transcriptional regulator with XRE-family HTH domain